MRRAASTLILLVVAAGFIGYLYLVDAKKPVADPTAKQKVFSVDATKIEQIQVKAESGDLTTLKKDASGWNIVKPVQTTADQNSTGDIASSLANAEQDRVVEESAADLKTYGLAEPRIDVTFNVTGEKEPRRIQLGDKSPTGMGVYAKLPNEKRVFLISNSFDTSLNRSTFDLRDKTAFKFDQEKVDLITLTSKDQTIQVVKTGDQWKLTKPSQAPADLTSVEGLLGQLHSAQMAALKESPDDLKDMRKYGLDKPELTATLAMGPSRIRMELGAKADANTFWARDPARPAVFSVQNGLAEELRKKPFDLRRKEIFEFRNFNTTRFEITRGKDTRAFERVKATKPNTPDTWKQVVPTVKEVDASNFEGALLEFSNLRADAAVDKAGPETGLNNPTAIITVKFENGKRDERVTFGGKGLDIFAARADQPGALKLEAGKFDEAIKKLDSIQ